MTDPPSTQEAVVRGREHEALLVYVPHYRTRDLVPRIRALRGRMPEWLRPMLIGPITPPLDKGVSFVFLPDGSTADKPEAITASILRRQLLGMVTTRWTDPDSGAIYEGCPVVLAQYGNRARFEGLGNYL